MKVAFNKNGVSRKVKVGFSWTVLFFGPMALVVRGMYLWALVLPLVNVMTAGLFGIYFAFIANEKYAIHLAERGWRVEGDYAPIALSSWGINQLPLPQAV